MNFLLFFRGALVYSVESRKRRGEFAAQKRELDDAAFHTCNTCGATDKSHPERHFRYKTVEAASAVCICEAYRGDA